MGPEKNNKKKSGKRIRGKLDFFKETPLDQLYTNLIFQFNQGLYIPEDMLHNLRTLFKLEVARRFAFAAKDEGVYEPFTETSKSLITDSLRPLRRHTYAHANVECIILYYNTNRKTINVRKSRNRALKKAFQHAFMDCLKAEEHYIKPFTKSDKKERGRRINWELYWKYVDMHSSIIFLGFLFKTYYCSFLPEKLSRETFKSALNYDSRMANNYYYDKEIDKYVRIAKKKYSAVCQECAVFLICQAIHGKLM